MITGTNTSKVVNRRKNINTLRRSDFFNESIGKRVSLQTRYLEDGSYFLYDGILEKKGRNFFYLSDVKVIRVRDDEVIPAGKYKKIAINKAIVSVAIFEEGVV